MMKKIIALLCAAALLAALFAGCAKTETTDPTGDVTESTSQAVPADDGTAAAEDVTADAETQAKDLERLKGMWEDAAVLYTFKEDGTGTVEDKETGTATPFAFTLDPANGVMAVSYGSPDDTEKIDYRFPSALAITLRFESGEILTLGRAARTNPLLGTWSDGTVEYVFFADGTGIKTIIAPDEPTGFNYVLADEGDAFTLYYYGADGGEETAFDLSREGVLTLTFADNTSVTLDKQPED